jgi:hypothetical protein
MHSLHKAVIAIVAALLIWNGNAAQVPVNDLWGANPGSGSGEWNLYNSGVGSGVGNGIMEYIYGAGNFTRLDDAALILWSSAGTSHSVGALAVYAGAAQSLYTAAPSGSPTSFIITPPGTINQNPARFVATQTFTPVTDPFLFLDQANGNSAYSDPSLSTGGIDRMVAFSVSGYLSTPGDLSTFTAFSAPTYVLGFEDGGDADYQDLVIEVQGVSNVPDGGTTLALLGGAFTLIGCARRFRK